MIANPGRFWATLVRAEVACCGVWVAQAWLFVMSGLV
jgi:hypothetical protein